MLNIYQYCNESLKIIQRNLAKMPRGFTSSRISIYEYMHLNTFSNCLLMCLIMLCLGIHGCHHESSRWRQTIILWIACKYRAVITEDSQLSSKNFYPFFNFLFRSMMVVVNGVLETNWDKAFLFIVFDVPYVFVLAPSHLLRLLPRISSNVKFRNWE